MGEEARSWTETQKDKQNEISGQANEIRW